MRILITGAAGQLGTELVATAPRAWRIDARDVAELDITAPSQVEKAIAPGSVDLVVNAAAWTAVDRAESEAEAAAAVNRDGAANVARAAARAGARLIHVSTDFVFDGTAATPRGPDAPAAPLSVYGRTKLEGERAVLDATGGAAVVVRSAWLYAARGPSFVHTMLRLMRERDEVRVVTDQIGTPTWARCLAEAIWAIAARPELRGILHWTDAGVASWYDFAVAIQEEALAHRLLERAIPVRPIRSAEYPTPARRPSYSVLDTGATRAALGCGAEHWRVNLRRMLQSLPHG